MKLRSTSVEERKLGMVRKMAKHFDVRAGKDIACKTTRLENSGSLYKVTTANDMPCKPLYHPRDNCLNCPGREG